MTNCTLTGEKNGQKVLQEILQNSPMLQAVINDRQKQAQMGKKLPNNSGD